MKTQDIIEEIVDSIETLEVQEGFNNFNGSSQARGKGEERNTLYGKYIATVELYETITNSTWITKKRVF